MNADEYGPTPPADHAAEQSVLGGMLQAAHVIVDVSDMLRGQDYYQPAHETIHDAIMAVYGRRDPVDAVTVAAELGRRGDLQRVGGPLYLHTLMAACPVPANATYYAQQVLEAALRRRMIDAATKVRQIAENAEDVLQAAEDARQVVDEATASASTTEGGTTVTDGLEAALDWLETPPVGADTPWQDVNEITNGLLAGQMITVAARPGHGKSLVAKDVALFTARQGKPVHIATLEMSRNEYMARMLAGLARVDLGRMLRRQMSEGDWLKVAEASNVIRDLPLYLDDRESQTMAQIRAGARQTARRFGGQLGAIVIDYAQLVRPRDMRLPREQQVAEISRATKLLAKEHACPVMLLAQLNRGNTQRADHTPLVSDLRESGSLEQDSDQVWLLHRPDQYTSDTDRLGEVDLIVGKNRNGPAPSTIPLAFQGHYARVVSLA